MISVVAGERTAENIVAVVEDFKRRTGGRLMDLITTKSSYKVAPTGLTYAVVEKTRAKGPVVSIATRLVFGTMAAVIAGLSRSKVSRAINTSFVERQNGTDRH